MMLLSRRRRKNKAPDVPTQRGLRAGQPAPDGVRGIASRGADGIADDGTSRTSRFRDSGRGAASSGQRGTNNIPAAGAGGQKREGDGELTRAEIDSEPTGRSDEKSVPWHQRTFDAVDLHCSICLELFNRPITLPCWHSFCLICLQNFLTGSRREFACPQCRQDTSIPEGGLREFVCNPRLTEALDQYETQKRAQTGKDLDSTAGRKSGGGDAGESGSWSAADVKEEYLTRVSILQSEASEKFEVFKDALQAMCLEIEAEYQLRLETLARLKDRANTKCLALMEDVESRFEDVDRRLAHCAYSVDGKGHLEGVGNTPNPNGGAPIQGDSASSMLTPSASERNGLMKPDLDFHSLEELRNELDSWDASGIMSFEAENFRLRIDRSRIGLARVNRGDLSPSPRQAPGSPAETAPADAGSRATTNGAETSSSGRREKRPLARTKALSGSEEFVVVRSSHRHTDERRRQHRRVYDESNGNGSDGQSSRSLSRAPSLASSLSSVATAGVGGGATTGSGASTPVLGSRRPRASSSAARRRDSSSISNGRTSATVSYRGTATATVGRAATVRQTMGDVVAGASSVRGSGRKNRPSILNGELEADIFYRTSTFNTRILVSSPQLTRPTGIAICPWAVNQNGKVNSRIPAMSRSHHVANGAAGAAADKNFAFFVVSPVLQRVCLCRVEEHGNAISVFKHFGRRGDGPGEFLHPTGIAIDRKHNEIYVTDNWQHCVHVFTVDGRFVRRWGMRGSALGHFITPGGVAVDDVRRDGPVVYVCDSGNNRVQILDRDGAFIGFVGAPGAPPIGSGGDASQGPEAYAAADGDSGFDEPISVAVDHNTGNVVIADSGNDRIKVYQTKDLRRPVLVTKFGRTGGWKGSFKKPDCVAVDSDGYVFVADNGNRRVQIFSQGGAFMSVALWDFRWAGGLAVAPDRRLLVADYETNRVKIAYAALASA